MARVTLKGSERSPLPGARIVAPAAEDERFEVTVLLRRRRQQEFQEHIAALAAGRHVTALTREEFAQRHGADDKDIKAVTGFAQGHGLAVVQSHAARRSVILSGTVQQFTEAFSVQLHHCHYDGGSYRGRSGSIQIPAELQDIIVAVLGLDNRPQARAHFRVHPNAAAAASFSPPQVASLYGFPVGSGEGQCVGLIELGGGFKPADLQAYFSGLGVGTTPNVIAVSVDNANNAPTGDANGPDGEVMLDIEVVGSLVPAAKVAVYFAPNTDAGFLDAITSAVHDSTNKPSVISISWGGPESSWTAQAMTSMDDALQAAATMGVTVCVASGDNGSSDGVTDGADHVDFPASSPFALACGGTTLSGSGATIRSESVWNDGANGGASGGGVSAQFALPSWQANLSVAGTGGVRSLGMRGVPDVSGDADPNTGYNVRVDGQSFVIGGTSAVAPLWAALVARLNQAAGKPLGFLNATLYKTPQGFRDVTQGNNGDFSAAKGWDACTGMGSPEGAGLAQALG